jgi:hypothetical protein
MFPSVTASELIFCTGSRPSLEVGVSQFSAPDDCRQTTSTVIPGAGRNLRRHLRTGATNTGCRRTRGLMDLAGASLEFGSDSSASRSGSSLSKKRCSGPNAFSQCASVNSSSCQRIRDAKARTNGADRPARRGSSRGQSRPRLGNQTTKFAEVRRRLPASEPVALREVHGCGRRYGCVASVWSADIAGWK